MTKDIEALVKVLKSKAGCTHEQVVEFEKEFAKSCGAEFCLAFSSVCLAMRAVSFALGFNSKDHLYLSPFVSPFIVTGPLDFGVCPVLIDITADGTLDLEQLKLNLDQPKLDCRDVIFVSHSTEKAVPMEEVDWMIESPDTVVIEDGTHCKEAGSCRYSKATLFNLANGAVITSNDASLIEQMSLYRAGGVVDGQLEVLGEASCMSPMEATLALARIKKPAKVEPVLPLYRHPYFRKRFGSLDAFFPESEAYCPLSP